MNLKNMALFFCFTFFVIFHTSGQKKVITVFSHGIADTWKQVHGYVKSYKKNNTIYRNDRYLIHTPFVSFNYPDATSKFYRVNYNETSFGQENEIGRLNAAYTSAVQWDKNKTTDVILCGLSRGASNVLIFAGLHDINNVKAIVIESPYYAMSEVIESLMAKKNLSWLDVSYGETVAEFIFKKYSRHGWSPGKCLENISKDIPILIICSQEDQLVPASTSINVYKKLVASGHKHTYIFIADHGKHAAILQGSDGDKYQAIVNAFYKTYNLPYYAPSARQGKSLLTFCQPQL